MQSKFVGCINFRFSPPPTTPPQSSDGQGGEAFFNKAKGWEKVQTLRNEPSMHQKFSPRRLTCPLQKGPSQKDISSSNHQFSGDMLVFRGYASGIYESSICQSVSAKILILLPASICTWPGFWLGSSSTLPTLAVA